MPRDPIFRDLFVKLKAAPSLWGAAGQLWQRGSRRGEQGCRIGLRGERAIDKLCYRMASKLGGHR